MKRILYRVAAVVFILFLTIIQAQAHKVSVFAYSEGDTIFTESYFPDGRKVKGGRIEVYDSAGTKLLEGTTDDNGLFNFKAFKKDDLKIVLNATMGHKNSFLLEADEIEAVAVPGKAATPAASSTPAKETTQGEPAQAVVQSPENSSKKPHRHIEPPQESHAIAILVGLGFIFGLTYLILHFTKKDGPK